MSRPKGVPSYRKHKQSGQAVVTLHDPQGRRRDVLLGKHGTAASKAEYARVLHEWEAMGHKLDAWNGKPTDLTVAELIAEYWPTQRFITAMQTEPARANWQTSGHHCGR